MLQLNEFFFASKIILVEGDTEQVALTQVKSEDTTILNCRGKANTQILRSKVSSTSPPAIIFNSSQTTLFISRLFYFPKTHT